MGAQGCLPALYIVSSRTERMVRRAPQRWPVRAALSFALVCGVHTALADAFRVQDALANALRDEVLEAYYGHLRQLAMVLNAPEIMNGAPSGPIGAVSQAPVRSTAGSLGNETAASAVSRAAPLWLEVNQRAIAFAEKERRHAHAVNEFNSRVDAHVAADRSSGLALLGRLSDSENALFDHHEAYRKVQSQTVKARAELAEHVTLIKAHQGTVAQWTVAQNHSASGERASLLAQQQALTHRQKVHGREKTSLQALIVRFNATLAEDPPRLDKVSELAERRTALQARAVGLEREATALADESAGYELALAHFEVEIANRNGKLLAFRHEQASILELLRTSREAVITLVQAERMEQKALHNASLVHEQSYGPVSSAALPAVTRSVADLEQALRSTYSFRTNPIGQQVVQWREARRLTSEVLAKERARLREHAARLSEGRIRLREVRKDIEKIARRRVESRATTSRMYYAQLLGAPRTPVDEARSRLLIARAKLTALEVAHWMEAISNTLSSAPPTTRKARDAAVTETSNASVHSSAASVYGAGIARWLQALPSLALPPRWSQWTPPSIIGHAQTISSATRVGPGEKADASCGWADIDVYASVSELAPELADLVDRLSRVSPPRRAHWGAQLRTVVHLAVQRLGFLRPGYSPENKPGNCTKNTHEQPPGW
ncbi:MAG: hypothetical protein ACI9W2_003102, partial [Gammaproteobacteria bacterium]